MVNTNHEDPEARYDGIEDYNSTVDLTVRKTRQFEQNLIGDCVVDLLQLPRNDLNAAAQAFMTAKGAELGLVSFAGSDGHNERAAEDVVWVYPAHLTPLEALKAGETSVYVRQAPTEVTPREYALMRASDTLGNAWQYIDNRVGGDIMRGYGGK